MPHLQKKTVKQQLVIFKNGLILLTKNNGYSQF